MHFSGHSICDRGPPGRDIQEGRLESEDDGGRFSERGLNRNHRHRENRRRPDSPRSYNIGHLVSVILPLSFSSNTGI